ncbi:hypothetical protein AKG60_23970 [Vibrio parahaemolyticus]|uniref:Uncharacterized protein n=2 Tax=Vibrio parahaemolyticus TaxID=670 RepID=A0AAX0M5I7_VIBPH|nr:hypothetical protein [Vibrio vulnificus]EGQ8302167.1 hypothetical protein [Vibrio parahaemolyticus]MCS0330300.1 hypothetical protein [Vibrio diabolicus]ARN69851.1 hypothetical protein FORC36_5334 [Vibrio vulnificus]EGQ8891129.1 hypothetical protein [Vibrio parahaemolyticus]EGR3310148.1 hypothetical protein [Vibrio parahaemolyticus]
MNGAEFLSNLEQINRPVKSIKKIRKALLNLKEIDLIDTPVMTSIERDDLILKGKSLAGTKYSYNILSGVKPIHTLGFLSAIVIGAPTLALTSSVIISSALTSGVFYSSFKMRKKWIRERIELLSERKEFKNEINIIAEGIKYLESLELTYNLGSIKQTTFKILHTTDEISAGEIITLVDELEKAFIFNEEIGFLREQAFDECYVPLNYRSDDENLSKLDFLTIDPNYKTVKQEAEEVQSEFEQLIDRPFKERDVDAVRLSKTLAEAKKETPLVKHKSEPVTEHSQSNNDSHEGVSKAAVIATGVATGIAITDSISDKSEETVDVDSEADSAPSIDTDRKEDNQDSGSNELNTNDLNTEIPQYNLDKAEKAEDESSAIEQSFVSEQSLSELLSSDEDEEDDESNLGDDFGDIEDELDFDLHASASAPDIEIDDDLDDGLSEDELGSLLNGFED